MLARFIDPARDVVGVAHGRLVHRAALASVSDTCGIAGAASMSRFQPFARWRSAITAVWRSVTLFRSRRSSRRIGVTTTRTCLRAPRAMASLIAVSSFATGRLPLDIWRIPILRRKYVIIVRGGGRHCKP